MTDTVFKMLVVLFMVGILGSCLTGSLIPFIELTVVAFVIYNVARGLRG